MPTYDYKCAECTEVLSIFQSMHDLPLTECPNCKGKLQRLISGGIGIAFKGTGFYATDSRKTTQSSGCGAKCPQANTCQAQKK